MNINNFEKHINNIILERGYNYYNEGNIVNKYKQGENKYTFQIQGSKDYEVTVQIDENKEILYSDCDCPYDFGDICKHEVAAYYELFNILNNEPNSTCEKYVIKKQEIEVILDSLSKKELINIIVDITQKDLVLKNNLIVRYSKGNNIQELEKCKKLIDSIVIKYTEREGFIKYRETYDFVSEMEDLLDKIRDTEDILVALDIAFLLLNEAIEAFQYADDSNGEIGSLVSETIGVIGEIVTDSDDLDIDLKEKIFNRLLMESNSKVFDGWEDYKIDIISICTEFADVEVLRNRLRMKIEFLVNENSGDEYKKYSNESMLLILFGLVERYGTKEEAKGFIKDNLKFTSFRELAIDKCIEVKNYHEVIELALEGEKQDKQYAGLISKWKKIRYTAYKELSMEEEQGNLAKELLFNGNFEYYNDLKKLAKENVKSFYNSLKQELKKNNGWHVRNVYLKLIEEENDLDELMEFVRDNPSSIEQYAEILIDKFKDEIIEIYIKKIKLKSKSASNRRQYQDVCRIIKRYEKIHERLVTLNITDASVPNTIAKYIPKIRKPPTEKQLQSWRTFLKNHSKGIWAMDFFIVPTLCFKVLYVFIIISHDRRKIQHFAVTTNPSSFWVSQQIREATPYGKAPKYLIHDNDSIFRANHFQKFLSNYNITSKKTSFHSPWQNGICERTIGILRQDLLNHIIPFTEKHLRILLKEYINNYYNPVRTHQGIGCQTPILKEKPKETKVADTVLSSQPILEGLYHNYKKVA